jgi:uncharacterized protein
MKYVTAAAVLCFTLVPNAYAQTNMVSQLSPDKPLLTITVTESVRAAPDVATVGVGVQSLAQTASAALKENSAQMDRVVKALLARKVLAKDMQTSGISLQVEYDYSQTNSQPPKPPRFNGYRVSNTIRVTTRDIAKLGELLDVMVTSGGTNVDGPYFAIEKTDALLRTARDKALAAAELQAKYYAAKTGHARARLVSLTEGQSFARPYSEMLMTAMNATESSAPVSTSAPIAPGQLATGVTLVIQYSLEN